MKGSGVRVPVSAQRKKEGNNLYFLPFLLSDPSSVTIKQKATIVSIT